MSLVKNPLLSILLLIAASSTAMAEPHFPRDYAISESCRLVEEQRYSDSVLMAERLRISESSDLGSQITAGAVALEIGATSVASAEFSSALRTKPLDPLALYGTALIELEKGQPRTALAMLISIDPTNIPPSADLDILVAKAICLAEIGDADGALGDLQATNDPAGAELIALINSRKTNSDTTPLTALLNEAMVNGIPQVIEPVGIRLLLPKAGIGPAVEPSITEREVSDDLANRFDSSYIASSLPDSAPITDSRGPLSPEQSDRIWKLLRIRPDYKVAEYELALALLAQRDRAGYETHILRAAALDPDYLDVRARIRPLFLGQVPDKFPVPDGTSLPSSLGLSAGRASAAGFWAGSPHSREIALTFDDGPIPIPTQQLLNALRQASAHGTFFVVGMRAVQSPDSLRQMAADGQAVEDHSYTHPNLAQILPQHVLPEILRTAVVIEATTGIWPHFIRPPGGNTNSLVLATAKACGMSGAFWTIDALPAEETGSPDAVAQWVIRRARPGAIVLMHNGMQATIGAIPKLVQGLRERGYKLVTITQLAADALADRHAKT